MKYALLTLALVLVSCAPTIRLDTPQPVKIDVNMHVDVTTSQKNGAKSSETPATTKKSPLESRRLRMAEIQDLKNNRFVGEGNNGLLSIRKAPDDSKWRNYAEKLVNEENADRQEVFEQEAKDTGKPTELVARDFAQKMRSAAFPTEWVQTESGEWKKN
ncbi:MAG: DUF1318 domain-containing protein [bacterium]